jgi:predicted nucleotidyltransferase
LAAAADSAVAAPGDHGKEIEGETRKRRLAVEPIDIARKLVTEWSSLFGPRLRSGLLFGSVARGEAVAGVSDVNVLLLVDEIDARTLKQASASTRNWIKTSREAPLLFEAAQWVRAADVFAIEIADMRDAHQVLHGNDPLEALQPDDSAMRLQAERELRGKLLQLQTGLLVAADAPADVGVLLKQSLPSFTTYMRALLRLTGETVPGNTPDVIDRATRLVGGTAEPYHRIWSARKEKSAFKLAVDDAVVEAYYDTAEKMADYVDTLRR